ncbi:MAG: carotenoid biosynthesis protein [Bacteroidota bacterium]
MERSKYRNQIGIGILAIFHLVGIIGLGWDKSSALFQRLVPLDLLLSVVLLIIYHEPKTKNWGLFALVVFLCGMGVEILGVNTGFPFGNYSYGKALGPKLFDTPPMIGVNWLVLTYATGIISMKFSVGPTVKALLGAMLMLFLDFLIEPVAIRLDFWNWGEASIPIENYLAWFLISFGFLRYFHSLTPLARNPLAFPFYVIQLLFFLLLAQILPVS